MTFGAPSPTPANDNARQSLNVQLLSAAEHAPLHYVQTLLEQGAQVNARGTSGDTPLIIAARTGNEPLVALLLAHQADATLSNTLGQTALHVAIRDGGIVEQLHALVEATGTAKNAQDMHGATAAYYAAQTGNPAAIVLLAQAGADFTLANKYDQSPLLWASMLSQNEAAVALMNAGAPLDALDKRGMTGMMHAANLGNAALLEEYLSRGANAQARAQDGRTAKDFALARGETALAEKIEAAIVKRYAAIHTGAETNISPMKRVKLKPNTGAKPS